MEPFDFLKDFAGGFNTTGYDGSADWSSASWGNGWAGTPGGVARQLGLEGRRLGEFARAVNNQKRRIAEEQSGYDYGYNPEIELPSWIQNLYESKGQNTGGIIPTGKSGVGKYVNLESPGSFNSGNNSKERQKERATRALEKRQAERAETQKQDRGQNISRTENRVREYTKLAGSKSENPRIRERVTQINKAAERQSGNVRRR